ncbi:hypothetical protein DE146DRAFT_786572 [Phaeosphaeria sp. MPI-PUGE-AT-0046c]|nr:hypothetical protein DE146DRAFT_786572 [Phaeosphaeria sp. MPI-PUGE-AT-0046c]
MSSPAVLTTPPDTNECALCYDPFSSSHPAAALPNCRHVFGSPCIEKWTASDNAQHNRCPECRALIFNEAPQDESVCSPSRRLWMQCDTAGGCAFDAWSGADEHGDEYRVSDEHDGGGYDYYDDDDDGFRQPVARVRGEFARCRASREWASRHRVQLLAG